MAAAGERHRTVCEAPTHGINVNMSPGVPYRLDLTVWALRRRPRNLIDRWDGAYRRALVVGERAVSAEVKPVAGDEPTLSISVLSPGCVAGCGQGGKLTARAPVHPELASLDREAGRTMGAAGKGSLDANKNALS